MTSIVKIQPSVETFLIALRPVTAPAISPIRIILRSNSANVRCRLPTSGSSRALTRSRARSGTGREVKVFNERVDHDDFDRATLKILRGYRDKRQPITRLRISISQSSGELVDLGEAHALTLDLADQRGSLLLQFRGKRTINVDASDGNERLVGIRRQEAFFSGCAATLMRTPAPGRRNWGVGSSVAGLITSAAAIPPDSKPQPRQKMAANMHHPRLASRTDGGRIKSGKIDVLTFGMIWSSPTLK